jgi:2,3-bisphosphoglycerate-dependent phosphoglycerate mutase
MKILVSVWLSLILFGLANEAVFAQQKYNKLTIILLRHAEKEKADGEDAPDPHLSQAGEARALKLEILLKKYKPDAVFSSQFKRTRSTIMPFARNRRMMIQIYNHRDLKEIAAIATAGNFKRIVIVGHNSTTPALTNLLIGQEKYKPLDESEYDKIFVVRIERQDGKPYKVRDEKIITY